MSLPLPDMSVSEIQELSDQISTEDIVDQPREDIVDQPPIISINSHTSSSNKIVDYSICSSSATNSDHDAAGFAARDGYYDALGFAALDDEIDAALAPKVRATAKELRGILRNSK